MNPLELIGVWYVFIGTFWAYLVAHEYITGGKFTKRWMHNTVGGVVFVVVSSIVVALVWPYSVWCYIRIGKMRDLFV